MTTDCTRKPPQRKSSFRTGQWPCFRTSSGVKPHHVPGQGAGCHTSQLTASRAMLQHHGSRGRGISEGELAPHRSRRCAGTLSRTGTHSSRTWSERGVGSNQLVGLVERTLRIGTGRGIFTSVAVSRTQRVLWPSPFHTRAKQAATGTGGVNNTDSFSDFHESASGSPAAGAAIRGLAGSTHSPCTVHIPCPEGHILEESTPCCPRTWPS